MARTARDGVDGARLVGEDDDGEAADADDGGRPRMAGGRPRDGEDGEDRETAGQTNCAERGAFLFRKTAGAETDAGRSAGPIVGRELAFFTSGPPVTGRRGGMPWCLREGAG